MPAEDRQNITMTPETRRYGKAIAKGRPEMHRVIDGKSVINWSAVCHFALALAAESPGANLGAPPIGVSPGQA